jgi:rhodanese-related sulfurtransferase
LAAAYFESGINHLGGNFAMSLQAKQPEGAQGSQPVGKHVSRVLQIAPASSPVAFEHFAKKLTFETDCADVYSSFASGLVDFVLVDVRGRQAYGKGHVSGAINIPLLTITEDRMKEYSPETVFVVYCAGPHCNGANKAAIRLSTLGRPVKEMIGGVTGWVDEGFTLVEE